MPLDSGCQRWSLKIRKGSRKVTVIPCFVFRVVENGGEADRYERDVCERFYTRSIPPGQELA